jgi:hypothetical protein
VQELELRCDGIAIITLSRLGLDPAHLMSAVVKLMKFNLPLGNHDREYAYPSLDERRTFNRAMIELAKVRNSASPSVQALSFFQAGTEQSLEQFLQEIRPPQVSPALKAQMIALLPQEGEVRPSAKGQAKLAALEPILKYHERASTVDLKVIRAGQLFIGLYARAAILITEEALDLLSAEELQAVVAHELAHEYFWDEYELARQHEHYARVQELELRCDGIAIITLSQLGLAPNCLLSAVKKLTRFGEVAGAEAIGRFYPARAERTRFTHSMIELVKARNIAAPRLAWK